MDATCDFLVERLEIREDGKHYLTVSFPLVAGGRGLTRFERGLLVEPHEAHVHFATQGARLPSKAATVFEAMLCEEPKEIVRHVAAAGWHGDAFISRFGCQIGGKAREQIVLTHHDKAAAKPIGRGTAKAYIQGLKPFLLASPYLVLTYVAALAAPFASRLGLSGSFAIALTQPSPVGKSLALRLAQSVTAQAGENDLTTLDGTAEMFAERLPALGGQAVAFLMPAKAASDRDVAEKLLTFVSLAAGSRPDSNLENEQWRPQFMIPLLSLQSSITAIFAGAELNLGNEVASRLLDVPVPGRAQGGIFAGVSDPDGMAQKLEGFLDDNFGMVLGVWIEWLATQQDLEQWRQRVASKQSKFCDDLGDLSPHHAAMASHLGLLMAVGVAAIRARILPLDPNELKAALTLILKRMRGRHETGCCDTVQAWEALLRLMEDDRRLPLSEPSQKEMTASSAGFRRANGRGAEEIVLSRQYLVEAFGAQTFRQAILPVLVSAGALPAKRATTTSASRSLPIREHHYRISGKDVAAMKAHLRAVICGFTV